MEDKPETSAGSPAPQPAVSKRGGALNYGSLFGGLSLIIVGGLYLLDDFGIIRANLGNLWRLWPFLIIAAGTSLIVVRGRVAAVLASGLIAVMLGVVILVALGTVGLNAGTPTTVKNSEISRTSEEAKNLNLKIKGGAGNIQINSQASSQLVKTSLESNFAALKQESTLREGTQDVTLTLDATPQWWQSNLKNDLQVTVTEALPVDLKVEAGASKIYGDLANISLRRLDIDTGASVVEFKLGNKRETTDVAIDVGMSSLKISAPKDSGVSLRLDSGMSTKDISGLRQKSDGYYESDNYATAANKINIRGNIGMSSFMLNSY